MRIFVTWFTVFVCHCVILCFHLMHMGNDMETLTLDLPSEILDELHKLLIEYGTDKLTVVAKTALIIGISRMRHNTVLLESGEQS